MADWRATSEARNAEPREEHGSTGEAGSPKRNSPGGAALGHKRRRLAVPRVPEREFRAAHGAARRGAPRPYEPRKRARGSCGATRSRDAGGRGRATGARERDRHRGEAAAAAGRRPQVRTAEGTKASSPRKKTSSACGHCQNDNWGWRKVRFPKSTRRDHHTQSATAARSRGPRTSRRARAAGRASTSATTRPIDARRRRTRSDGYDDFGRRKKAKKSKAERGRRWRRWWLQAGSAFRRRALYCLGYNAGRGARAAPGAHGPH